MLLNQTIRLFLDSIGRREEYEFYLNKFQSAHTACFALLVPDLESLDSGAEAFAFDLHFLLRLGLKPAVVLSGTDADAKWARLAHNPLFEKTTLPMVGTVNNRVPVFFQPLEQLIPTLGKRVHFIRPSGGFEVEYYYTQKENNIELTDAEQQLANKAATLLATRPSTHISVTSSRNLLEEIFTVKGAGTLFRKGSTILSPDFQTLEKSNLQKLLKESFKKTPKKGIFDAVTTIYQDKACRGAVLLEQHPEGTYLSKFAVGSEARGEGLAQELWMKVCEKHAAFFWRSRIGNPVNQWYDRQADGYHTTNDWMVFWRGVAPETLPGIITFCEKREPDFL